MKTPEELRKLADKKNKKLLDSFEKIKPQAYREHLRFIEESLEEAAAQGHYQVMSENLFDTSYLDRCKYDPEVLQKYLVEKLASHFVELGFSVSGTDSNYLTVSFKEKHK